MYLPLLPLLVLVSADPAGTDAAYQEALIAALHQFAENGQLPHVKAILDKHPKLVNSLRKPNVKPYGDDDYTLLHRAAVSGNHKMASYLIEMDAKVNSTAGVYSTGGGWTPLHMAARYGHLSVVKLLVEKGAQLDARTGVPTVITKEPFPYADRTALELANLEKQKDVVDYLKAAKK